MPGAAAKGAPKVNDTYAAERQQARAKGVALVDRFMPSGHIGHNKFQVLQTDAPQAVLFGSTNWTSHALCAQTNNTIIARSPALATAYRAYWDRLRADTAPPGEGGRAQQSRDFRKANAAAHDVIPLEDGSGTVKLMVLPQHPGRTPEAARQDRSRPARPGRIVRRHRPRPAGHPLPRLRTRLPQHRRGDRRSAQGQAVAVRPRRRDIAAGLRRLLHRPPRHHRARHRPSGKRATRPCPRMPASSTPRA